MKKRLFLKIVITFLWNIDARAKEKWSRLFLKSGVELEYIAFGEVLFEEHASSFKSPYLFNGKELDRETNLSYYGARYHDKKTSLWLSVDEKMEKYPNTGAYVFTANNPIMFIDPDGKDIIGVFNKSTGKLAIIDKDNYKVGLPILTVSASDYKLGGIRDKKGNLTHNQVLVLDNVFSGGRSDSDGNIDRNLTRDSGELAIPNGSYDLTEYEGGRNWYKIDPIDSSRYDDQNQGHKNSDGKTRNGYRLHTGNLSHGCITIADPKGDRSKEYGVLQKILETTSKTEVPKREGMQKYNPISTRAKYGTINVTGKDRVKEVKQNE
jgi:RHS repeat-associated protein